MTPNDEGHLGFRCRRSTRFLSDDTISEHNWTEDHNLKRTLQEEEDSDRYRYMRKLEEKGRRMTAEEKRKRMTKDKYLRYRHKQRVQKKHREIEKRVEAGGDADTTVNRENKFDGNRKTRTDEKGTKDHSRLHRKRQKSMSGFAELEPDRIDDRILWYVAVPPIHMIPFLLYFKNDSFMKSLMKSTHEKAISSCRETSYFMFNWVTERGRDSTNADWRRCPLLDAPCKHFLHSFLNQVKKSLFHANAIVDPNDWEALPGIVHNRIGPAFQNAHRDCTLTELPVSAYPYILHMPLCKEGMALQVWDERSEPGKAKLRFVYVPFGRAIVCRADVYHAGCFGSIGNVRLHVFLKRKDRPWENRRLSFITKDKTITDHERPPESLDAHEVLEMAKNQYMSDPCNDSFDFARRYDQIMDNEDFTYLNLAGNYNPQHDCD